MATNEQKKANDTAAVKEKQQAIGVTAQKQDLSMDDVYKSLKENTDSMYDFFDDDYSKKAEMDRRASLTVMPKIGISLSTYISNLLWLNMLTS